MPSNDALEGAKYSAYDLYNALVVQESLDLAPITFFRALDTVLASWEPHMYRKRHPGVS